MLKGVQLNTYLKLENIRAERGAVAIALLDPDIKNNSTMLDMLNLINASDFAALTRAMDARGEAP